MMPARTRPADAERVAKALGSARPAGDGWSCRCPAHEDHHASLSLTARDGRLLWRCHAGCSQSEVQEALAAAGLIGKADGDAPHRERPAPTGRHLRTLPGGKEPQGGGLGRIVATYDYLDVTGALLFQVVRFEPKTFRQRRPKGGGWEWGLGRVEPVPYRLPEVLAATGAVFVVEGEKAVERLRDLGMVATCSPMGAGKWRDAHGQALAGKHVVVLPDNDDPGRSHAGQVAASARAHGAASVRVLALPGLPDKGDVVDWLDAGGDAETLRRLSREAPAWGAADGGGGDPGWRRRLLQSDNGPIACEANVEVALLHAPELVGRLRHDVFRAVDQCRDTPWEPRSPDWRDWTDRDDVELAMFCQRAGVNVRPDRAACVAHGVARRIEHHPVRDYLRGLRWDGTPRIDAWLSTYLGVAYGPGGRTAYVQAVGAKWLISAVARVMDVPCKVDTALVLEGGQGIGKSSALAALVPDPAWFADQIADLGTKDSAQDLAGKWIVELGELSAMGRPEVERVKSFMSRQVDHYRPSYGRRSIDAPRQCVFGGSTNREDYLRDETGNRRFWPARCTRIDLEALRRDRDQLWAEAFHRQQLGEAWHLGKEIVPFAEAEQASRVQPDPWHDIVVGWLALQTSAEHAIHEILRGALAMRDADMTQREMNRVSAILRIEKWTREQKRAGGCRTWVYRRPT